MIHKNHTGKDADLTEKTIGAFYNVYNALGYGFLEKDYENALLIALFHLGLQVEQQKKINVYFQVAVVGEYVCDLIVENKVVLEVKSVQELLDEHKAQLANYLKATKIEIGLLLNFGAKAEIKRLIFDNQREVP